MTSRERVLCALNHEEPDRVPIDFGGTLSSTINIAAYDRLMEYLGLPGETDVMSIRSHTALVGDAILEKYGVDTRGLFQGSPERSPAEKLADGSYKDQWGVVRRRPKGVGHFIDVGHPFDGDPTLADLNRHPWPDPNDDGYVSDILDRAEALHRGTDYAVLLTLPVGIVHQCQFLRGYEGWMVDLACNETFFHGLMEHVYEIWAGIASNMLRAAGEHFDVVWYGDDVAFQDGPLCSVEMYRKHIKPWEQKVFDLIRDHTDAKILYHCCGSVYQLMPEFLDFGIDALNPIQVASKHMETKRLKEAFGDRITFWGAIDTQHVLPYGSADEVRQEVRQRISDLAPGGGYVLASVHNIQREVPPENVVAMLETAAEFGRYPVK
jgi:uroporphyrinogen decarboxylase